MGSVSIGDVDVSFPFTPYPAQLEYMRAVIDALNGGVNALLESPTGTGKTLCLLCAVLAWTEKKRSMSLLDGSGKPVVLPRLIYCSRTHAQLAQVIRELKRTRYGEIFSMALLGSREHMCVNSHVLRLPTAQAQQTMCNILRDEKNCRFYRGFQARGGHNTSTQDEKWVHDMEDLVSDARKCGYCPYYSERERAKEADVLFLPYNYVLDASLHKQLMFDMKGAILIVDEAHNLPSVLASFSCVNLQPLELTNAIHDCSRAIAMRKLMAGATSNDDDQDGLMEEQELASLKIILCGLETCILEEHEGQKKKKEKEGDEKKEKEQDSKKTKNIAASQSSFRNSTTVEIVREGSYMIPFLAKALITRDLFFGSTEREGGGMNEVITKAIAMLSQSESAAVGLSRIQQFLTFVFERCEDPDYEACRFVIQGVKGVSGHPAQASLGYWCLDTSRTVQKLFVGLRSLLLTSGTLSPLEHFAAEIGISFDVCLKGGHVIQPNQVACCVLCKGPTGEKLNGSYAFRSSVDYRVGLGMSLVNIARNTPGGVLVFFPSYVALNAAVELWRSGSGRAGETVTVWGMLAELKPVYVEPVETADFHAIVSSFQREVDNAPSRGAILLAVCRGKISEGIDFADHHGRCVVVAGIPFANHTDLFVRLKRAYITRVASQRPKVRGKLFTGDEWYLNEAMRAVNQCVGRVIRHKDDYGVVVLADERFADHVDGMSEWVAKRCSVHREFRETYACVAQFFASFRRSAGGTLRPCASSSSSVPASDGCMKCPDTFFSSTEQKIPDSAEMARRFASERLRLAAAQEKEQLRDRLADAREVPTVPLRATPVTPAKDNVEAESKEEEDVAINAAAPTMGRLAFKKQVLPAMDAVATPSTLVGSSSKEFCQFLKNRLKPASYDSFRDRLRQIASVRNASGVPTDEMKGTFCSAVDGVAVLFREAAGEHETELLHAFGEHIPEELRPYYMHLVRKRLRTL